MYETNQLSLPTSAEIFFNFLLQFYPQSYRKRFGQEMLFVFKDTYQEELKKRGKVGIGFWLVQVGDITKSVLEQHIDEIGKKGMKKYLQQTLHINTYNIISLVFLLPVILMTGIEIISRIVQGDLTHYNRPVYAFFSHTFLYWTPVLFTWVILFPLIAAILSLIPLIKSLAKKNTPLFSWVFIQKNILGIAILLFGLGFIALIRLHDFAPCVIHGLTHVGFGQFSHIIAVCRNA